MLITLVSLTRMTNLGMRGISLGSCSGKPELTNYRSITTYTWHPSCPFLRLTPRFDDQQLGLKRPWDLGSHETSLIMYRRSIAVNIIWVRKFELIEVNDADTNTRY